VAHLISNYPELTELHPSIRVELHPRFQELAEGISEFTFANLYLFREAHHYRIGRLGEEHYVITGRDGDQTFFMLPFGLPEEDLLRELFERFGGMKAVSEGQAEALTARGHRVEEDRDNFDYLYGREELANLPGSKFHKKKNRVNAFIRDYEYEGRPLLEEYKEDCLALLEEWPGERDAPGDYAAAREGLERMWELQLCGGIYYVEGRPAAYSLGEELARGRSFAIHFEKAIGADRYRGIYQFINQAFAAILPEKYESINREQDLGIPGLRQAKESYHPMGFVKKYRAFL